MYSRNLKITESEWKHRKERKDVIQAIFSTSWQYSLEEEAHIRSLRRGTKYEISIFNYIGNLYFVHTFMQLQMPKRHNLRFEYKNIMSRAFLFRLPQLIKFKIVGYGIFYPSTKSAFYIKA